jgi:UDP-N-acetylglucosamine 2-epimerase (non-hydrolysing)
MLIDIIAGARPNFMKIAPIIEAIHAEQFLGTPLSYRLVHTGQHSDRRMSAAFFEQLGIPEPHIKLEVSSGSHAEMTAEIMVRYERVLAEKRPDMVLVVGDVTSTLACAVTAKKMMDIPVAHVEAGIRSGDWTMPEEINRIVTDSVTDYFFTTSATANENLKATGIPDAAIYFVGNTMIDTLLKHHNRFCRPDIWDELDLTAGQYLVLTLHRPATVDTPKKLGALITAIIDASQGRQVIFPIHPRTASVYQQLNIQASNLHITEPLPYLQFNYLVKHAQAVVTDSGGITEEATVMHVPCMTIRDNTERPETCTIGSNKLLGTNPAAIAPAFDLLFSGQWQKGDVPPLWDGKTAQRIVTILKKIATSKGTIKADGNVSLALKL